MVNIYGHEVELTEVSDDDGVVTDVIVLARTVRFNDEGKGEDALIPSGTRTTTYMLQLGMLHTALESLGMAYDDDEDEQ